MQTCVENISQSILKHPVIAVKRQEFNRITRVDIIYRDKYILFVRAIYRTLSGAIQLRASVVLFSIDSQPTICYQNNRNNYKYYDRAKIWTIKIFKDYHVVFRIVFLIYHSNTVAHGKATAWSTTFISFCIH